MPLIRAALYLAVSGLFGSTLLIARNPAVPSRAQWYWLIGCALGCAGLSAAGLWLQAAEMSGGEASASLVWSVVRDMGVGRAALLRMVAALAAAALLVGPDRRPRRLWASASLGAVATGSLAWSGHGAAGDGLLGAAQLAADLAHLLAAALWVGAIAFLAILAAGARTDRPRQIAGLQHALASFSTPGTVTVVVLGATGAVNAWRLIGPEHASAFYTDPYGRLLTLKLLLFGVMLALAAANRWRRVPQLQSAASSEESAAALRAARLSLLLEFGAGAGVLLTVGWMGVLPPPAGT